MPPPSRPETELDSRRRIMDVAAELFLDRGVEGGSLRQIADLAGMKAGSLYYHFSSKNDLLLAIFERGISVMMEAFDQAEAADHLHPKEQFEAHVRAHLGALYENGPYTAAHVTAFRTAPPEVQAAVVPSRDCYEAMWTNLIARLVGTGALADSAGDTVHRLLLFGAMNTSVEWFDADRGTLDTLASAITQQFWNGLGHEIEAAA